MKYMLWPLLVLAIGATIMWQWMPLKNSTERLEAVQKELHGKPATLTSIEQNFFKDTNIVKLSFRLEKGLYWVFMIDATKNRHVIHDPRFCFQGAGWKLEKEIAFSLPRGEGKQLYFSRNGQKKQLLYWFANGKVQFHSFMRFWLTTTLRRLTLGHFCEEPVLIMVESESDACSNVDALQQELKPLLGL